MKGYLNYKNSRDRQKGSVAVEYMLVSIFAIALSVAMATMVRKGIKDKISEMKLDIPLDVDLLSSNPFSES